MESARLSEKMSADLNDDPLESSYYTQNVEPNTSKRGNKKQKLD